jgi:hypothetical protein
MNAVSSLANSIGGIGNFSPTPKLKRFKCNISVAGGLGGTNSPTLTALYSRVVAAATDTIAKESILIIFLLYFLGG